MLVNYCCYYKINISDVKIEEIEDNKCFIQSHSVHIYILINYAKYLKDCLMFTKQTTVSNVSAI